MNVEELVWALEAHRHPDSMKCGLTHSDWLALAPFLSVHHLDPGETVIREGSLEREVFFLADGELQVASCGAPVGRLQPGSVVGAGGFFSGAPRGATVTPLRASVAWSLRWDRYETMSRKHPSLGVSLAQGLARILATRLRDALPAGHFT